LKKSWHKEYDRSAWIYIGGLPYDLTEGDVIAVFSQYGEVVNINLMRDWKTGKSRGFCYLCYQDQKSTVLAVDNFNGIKLLSRTIQVDHVKEYRPPTYKESVPEEIRRIWEEGCAPKPISIPEDRIKSELESEKKRLKKQKKKLEKHVVPIKQEEMDEATRKELKETRKRLKKQAKLEKKRLKAEKRRLERGPTPEDERGRPDDLAHWDAKKKKIEHLEAVDEEAIYGGNDAFNFNKKRKEKEEPKFNVRPDFDKADWRDIEIFKAMREKDRAEKGPKNVVWEEEKHYLPKRFGTRPE